MYSFVSIGRPSLLLLATLIGGWTCGAAPGIGLSSAGAPAGNSVTTLLTLEGGAGVAGMRIEINYDPQVLVFDRATAGQLGSLFDLAADAEDGRLFLTLARTEGLVSGQGILARLHYLLNPGAKPGVASDVVVAQAVVVNEAGAHLEQEGHLVASSGSLAVAANCFAEFVDLDADGLSDDWEDAWGLPTDRANAWEDPDGDGRINLVEYAVGSDPLAPDTEPILRLQREWHDGEYYLTLSYFRNKAATNVEFHLESSKDLDQWEPLAQTWIAARAIDHGETEQVLLRETSASMSVTAQFIRLGFSLR